MNTKLITASAAILFAASAQAQTESHLTFETESDGVPMSSITDEAGVLWFPFAANSAEEPVGSSMVPPASLRNPSAPATTVSGDFSPGFGYLEADGDAFDLPDTGWTIEAFVRFNAVGGHQTILGRDKDILEDRTAFADLYFQKDNTDRFACSYTVRFDDNGDGTFTHINAAIRSEERALVAQKWYHLAAVYNASGPTLSVYIDGKLEGETTVEGNIHDVADPFFQFWTVGRGQYNDGAVDGLNGQIDDLRVTGAALTPDQFLGASDDSSGPTCIADINGDNVLDIDDVLAFLSAFAAGCP